MSKPPLLQLQGVSKHFGGVTANENVTFHVGQGEIVGLIGPNGAGKTTLFSLISGFLKPNSGSIYFNGANITGKQPDVICKSGLTRTYQIVKPFQDMTVMENIMVASFAHTYKVKKAKEIAQDIIELTGMKHKTAAFGRELTIAEKKRLELSRALATNPQLLLLDEVMAGLTPAETHEAVELIHKISKRVTLLIIEHVMEVIMPISHRVVVLDMGKVICIDQPDKVAKDERVIKAYLGEKAYASRS
ncbi:MAG: transporter related protein [Paenibacillus sp.]|nr:transporter related protein [Paenibacillus sp.]